MKISGMWCGLFVTVGAGLGLTAYFSQQAKDYCHDEMLLGSRTLLDLTVEPTSLSVDVVPDNWPFPAMHVALKNLVFLIRSGISPKGIDLFENFVPDVAGNVCNASAWIAGAFFTLTMALLVMQTANRYEIRQLRKELTARRTENNEIELKADHYIFIGDSPRPQP